jgi:hypothetical protein
MSDESLVKGALAIGAFFLAFFAIAVAVPIFSTYLLIRGWDNTGGLVKVLAILLPIGGLWTIGSYLTGGNGQQISAQHVPLIIGAVILNYVFIAIAYSRRQFVGM